jgi:cation:H+ antiporter
MVAAAVVLLPIAFTGTAIARWEGALFLLLYAAYTTYLLLDAAGHDALDGFTTVMWSFVLPLLALAIVAQAAYEVGKRRGANEPLLPDR